jgi:PTS system nitrogen regulatory IIA component
MQIDVREAAKLLNVSDKTVYRWVKKGDLPHFKSDGSIRFYRSELLDWALNNRINVAADFRGDTDTNTSVSTGLKEALAAGGIHYRICGNTISETLTAVTQQLTVLDESDRDLLLQFLLARESLGSTGIGGGISIPHPRNPIITNIPSPIISLCFLENPIDYKAIDGVPVDTFFLLICPTVKDHLTMLSRIAYALRDPDFMKVIKEKANRETLLEQADIIDKKINLNKEKQQ